MPRITTTVSIEADRDYVDLLLAVARKQGKSMGRIVREACDSQLGPEIKEAALFFAKPVANTQRNFDTSTSEESR